MLKGLGPVRPLEAMKDTSFGVSEGPLVPSSEGAWGIPMGSKGLLGAPRRPGRIYFVLFCPISSLFRVPRSSESHRALNVESLRIILS